MHGFLGFIFCLFPERERIIVISRSRVNFAFCDWPQRLSYALAIRRANNNLLNDPAVAERHYNIFARAHAEDLSNTLLQKRGNKGAKVESFLKEIYIT